MAVLNIIYNQIKYISTWEIAGGNATDFEIIYKEEFNLSLKIAIIYYYKGPNNMQFTLKTSFTIINMLRNNCKIYV